MPEVSPIVHQMVVKRLIASSPFGSSVWTGALHIARIGAHIRTKRSLRLIFISKREPTGLDSGARTWLKKCKTDSNSDHLYGT